jgi:hypothetical protein
MKKFIQICSERFDFYVSVEKLREDCCKCGGKKLSWGKVTICDDGVWEEKVYSGWWGFMLV